MAKALFKMRFGGAFSGKSTKTGKDYCSIILLEEIETRDGDIYVNCSRCFSDTIPADIQNYKLYQVVDVVLDVSSDGKSIRFVSIAPYVEKEKVGGNS